MWHSGKELACQCRRHKRCRFDPWSDKICGEGNGNPLQYSCLENPMDRGAWQATVHGVQTVRHILSDWACTHTHTYLFWVLTSLLIRGKIASLVTVVTFIKHNFISGGICYQCYCNALRVVKCTRLLFYPNLSLLDSLFETKMLNWVKLQSA